MTEYDNENGKSKTDTMMANQNSSLIIEDEERTADNPSSSDETTGDGETSPFVKTFSGEEQIESVKDYYNLVFLIVLLHGVGVLLPWNTFLTIGDDYYVRYKFANTTYTGTFFQYLTASSQIPNLTLCILNLFAVIKGGIVRRINISLAVIMTICVVTIMMIFVNSKSWPFGFFLFTILTVILLNSANGIYQNCVWGLIADFPGRFTNAIIQGNNLCGIFVTCVYILILLFSPSIEYRAAIFFGIALLTTVACLATFHILPKLAFYQYHTTRAHKARTCTLTEVEQNGELIQPKPNLHQPSLSVYIATFKEVWSQLLDVWLVFFVTLALFPKVLLDINPGNTYDILNYGDKISKSLFQQLTIFLNFNFFATVGNVIANYIQWPSPKHLSYAVVARILFLPLFWLYNYTEGRHFVLIKNEYSVTVLISLMAITHGYYSSLAMMYAPRLVEQSKARVVGMMSGLFLVFGSASGIMLTFVEPSKCLVDKR